MRLIHFYHCWAHGSAWKGILQEHCEALVASDFPGVIVISIDAESDEEGERARIEAMMLATSIVPRAIQFTAPKSLWEQGTLKIIHRYAKLNTGVVLYAHTKGAAYPTPFNESWRRSMQRHVVEGWARCLGEIEGGADAVGCHYILPETARYSIPEHDAPLFGGNYWMASCRYLADLPPCREDQRHRAESWIGINRPKVVDLLPGWPSLGLFMEGDGHESAAMHS